MSPGTWGLFGSGPDSVPPEYWDNTEQWRTNERIELSPRDPHGWVREDASEAGPETEEVNMTNNRNPEDLEAVGRDAFERSQNALEEVSRRAAKQRDPLGPGGSLSERDNAHVKLDQAGQLLRIFEDHARREAELNQRPDDHDNLYRRYKETLGDEPGARRRGMGLS